MRFFGVRNDIGEIMAALAETMVGLLRCALAVAVLHSDITAVARRAAKAQKWQRKAADARLHAIQQFTRYIFHEARVPLQAVSLAVDELEEEMKEGAAKSKRLAMLEKALRNYQGQVKVGETADSDSQRRSTSDSVLESGIEYSQKQLLEDVTE